MQSLSRIGYTLNGAMPLDGQNFPQGLSQLSLQQIMADSQAQQVYNHLDTTYQAYQQAVSRDSMNGTGGPIRFVIHHGSLVWAAQYTYDYLVFGEGGGGYVSPATNLDSVSHEFGHGVVAHEAGFAFTDAAVDGGTALHEAFADLSTTLVDVHLHGSPTAGQNITWTMMDHVHFEPQHWISLLGLSDSSARHVSGLVSSAILSSENGRSRWALLE
jgi:Zn-dependent metalloprotease